jgi:hypothetical protein
VGDRDWQQLIIDGQGQSVPEGLIQVNDLVARLPRYESGRRVRDVELELSRDPRGSWQGGYLDLNSMVPNLSDLSRVHYNDD